MLDAIAQVNGLSQLSSTHIWIARPAPGNFSCEQIMPVDWVAITQGAVHGDQLPGIAGRPDFIEQDQMVAFNNIVSKIISPFERVVGFVSLGSRRSAARRRWGGSITIPPRRPTAACSEGPGD